MTSGLRGELPGEGAVAIEREVRVGGNGVGGLRRGGRIAWRVALGAALASSLLGCQSGPYVVAVRSEEVSGEGAAVGTGWVLAPGEVLTVDHVAPAERGDEVTIVTRWARVRGVVVERSLGWVRIRCDRDLQPGDSGSPVFRGERFVGAVEARVRGVEGVEP